jgi:putative sugar phosphate isomerase/epimerase
MSAYEKISGFADEISQDFDQQLKTVTDLGMKYICIRSAEHKGIADYTPEEVRTVLLPKLRAAGVGVSSLGTAIGKVEVDDEEGFAKQLEQLETLCETARLLDCSFIRMFSFLIPKDADADSYTDVVLDKLRQFIRIAEKHDIVLLHENEKGIYGDTGARCKLLFDRLACPHFKAAFDFANFVQCEQDTAECWELLHDQIVYIHIKDALPGYLLNVPAGTGLGKIPELLRRAFCEEGYHGFLTLEPHLAMFDFFAPGAKGGKSQKLQFENNPIVEKMKSEMAEPGRPKDGAEAYATQYHALVEILNPILN